MCCARRACRSARTACSPRSLPSKPSAWIAATTCTPRLSAVMLDRHEQQALFDAAFDAFWRDPKLLEQLMYLLLPKISGRGDKQRPPRANRLAEALALPRAPEPPPSSELAQTDEIRFETTFSFSERERLQQADFETMTAAEFALAKTLAERLPLPVQCVRRRRHEAAARGSLDLRATMQRMARQPHTLSPAFTRPRSEIPTTGGAARHLGLDGTLRAAVPALRAWADAALPRRPHLHVRHPADQHHALPQAPRPRRCVEGCRCPGA